MSTEMNDDATEWAIVIRDDVVFHDGNPLAAADVLYSLSYLAANPAGMMGYVNVDFEASTSDGAQTVMLRLARSQATLLEEGLAIMSLIFPEGTVSEDFGTDLGSGPYRLLSCSAETGVVLETFEDHWAGTPAIVNVEIVPIVDTSTRMTVLQAGQIGFANTVNATDAALAPAGIEGLPGEATHSSAFVFSLNCAPSPFDDPEVRRAFKRAVDCGQLVQTIFCGEGEVGNDVFGKGLPSYNDAMEQIAYDPDAAAEVLAAKGVTELTILTSEITPGIRDSATLLAQRLQKVGVTLSVVDIVLMGAASVVRPVRAVVVRQNAQPSVEAARLVGLGEGVLGRHILPGCAAPIAQALASVVPFLVGGAAAVEKAFAGRVAVPPIDEDAQAAYYLACLEMEKERHARLFDAVEEWRAARK